LKLFAGKKCIELQVNSENWCQVFFHHGQSDELGADSKDVVVKRFLAILQVEKFPDSTHELEGKSYACFIMLFEKHASGYARQENSDIFFQFRNGEGKVIDEVVLNADDALRWKNQLEEF